MSSTSITAWPTSRIRALLPAQLGLCARPGMTNTPGCDSARQARRDQAPRSVAALSMNRACPGTGRDDAIAAGEVLAPHLASTRQLADPRAALEQLLRQRPVSPADRCRRGRYPTPQSDRPPTSTPVVARNASIPRAQTADDGEPRLARATPEPPGLLAAIDRTPRVPTIAQPRWRRWEKLARARTVRRRSGMRLSARVIGVRHTEDAQPVSGGPPRPRSPFRTFTWSRLRRSGRRYAPRRAARAELCRRHAPRRLRVAEEP